MKKRVLFYLVALVTTVSMQSCATNYVVSKPATYTKEYKTDAKLASIDSKKMEQDKQKLIDSFLSEKAATLANAKKAIKNSEIAKVVKYNKTIDGILEEAETYLGTPYRYGGTTRNGIDCSAFVLSVFGAAAGLSLPRVAASQAQEGERIEKGNLQKGDLIFFSHGRRISHVGIVESVSEEGEIKFIHAATSKGVMISSLNDSYWGPKFRFAKRVINEEGEAYNNLAAVTPATPANF
ncbi:MULTISPECIES: C40 family peptidase [Chryseobacterium]|jgi:lipoprotein Spr|uniref:Hydrolase Nlp/P60 n=1 Tax=Chryseobacterium rhizosphaerae TaxID=395937 RepID=A0AAE3Y872_9FLAO|nr:MULTISPECIES: NlpC/P60 family protein [Chryseobacterium]MBL3550085.1 C40 family peptidase [Chryseobacterium sp. KMC2]MDC8102243.1 NlpC/P60 family protein [Chryseobacterium rhizosphaerae]MDR6526824.1 lipoprotein Spr [Chryseobacterium rhizosphaerae]MDR6544587.1 lipoprotein Spr [Chryseobacterium rhizosphaerae]REC78324.1 hydrolase Nlp/P60 [Chryseobacterium rhizosphaerae]